MDLLIKHTARYSFIFLTVAMIAIVYFGSTRVIEISGIGQEDVRIEDKVPDQETSAKSENTLMFDASSEYTDYLGIPLPESTQPDDITIENHYMDHQLVVRIKCDEPGFYRNNPLSGNRDSITDGTFEEAEEETALKFEVDNVYEYKTVLENNNLYISFYKPRELYDKIVVIDPAHGGSDIGVINSAVAVQDRKTQALYEKDVNLKIAQRLKELLDESGVKAYYTRMDDVNPSEDSRVSLCNTVRADAYIRIEVDRRDDSSVYGVTCKYNDEYFIPGFGNVELADIMEKSVATEVKGRALGLVAASGDDGTLLNATVPACTVMVGCISNGQEAILLSRDDYVEKIATGLYKGITGIYEER
ncbi:MAG: N-acetylmuramoyl-L-alanine amidase [Lachnospiraceae bacterium]|nr:N-acetylmuramoyl-L-alanine amidase [Lachnospiraceae bacterium]